MAIVRLVSIEFIQLPSNDAPTLILQAMRTMVVEVFVLTLLIFKNLRTAYLKHTKLMLKSMERAIPSSSA